MPSAAKTLIGTGDIDVQFLIDDVDSGGSTTAFICRVAPGGHTPPPHSHGDWDETVYCSEGGFMFTIDGEGQELRAGEALCIRRGQVHHFANIGSTDGRMLVVSTPGLFHESYFVSIAEILNAAGDGPPDFAALGRVMAEHGVTPAPAPTPA